MALSVPGLGDSAATAPAFKPAFKVSKQASSGGLLAAASSTLGMAQTDPWAACVQAIQLDLQLAPGVDLCMLETVGAALPEVTVGDALKVELGYVDQLQPVYSGRVARLYSRHDGSVQITLDNGALTLARRRQNTSFEQQTLNNVVSTLLADAGITQSRVDTGVNFPFLAIDDRQSLWAWIAVLASHSACRAWIDNSGVVQVKASGGPTTATFRYGSDMLSMQHGVTTPQAETVTVTGEGAAGSQGSAAWSWLSKKSKGISAKQGSRGDERQQSAPVLRHLAAVQDSARFWQQQLKAQSTRIRLTVPGNAALAVGAMIRVSGCPQGRGDGEYLLTRVCHVYEKKRGFVTQLEGQAGGVT